MIQEKVDLLIKVRRKNVGKVRAKGSRALFYEAEKLWQKQKSEEESIYYSMVPRIYFSHNIPL